jgi:predicted PurR-regulated permease PerM
MESSARWIFGAIIVAVSAWILQGFVHALLAAVVIAIASWPLYRRFTARLPRKARRAAPLLFTTIMAGFVFAPLMFAFGALASEVHALLVAVADADRKGFALRHWLHEMSYAGRWIDDVWGAELARPGALLGWAQRAEPKAVLAWAQSLGQFLAHHAFIILFTLLVLFFLYERGERLARDFRALLRRRIGAHANAYITVATRAVRASVNGIVVVGLFDGVIAGAAWAIAGVPDAALWAAITGALALIPFLGYAAVAALALRLVMAGAGASAMLAAVLGCLVLLAGDKIVRPGVTSGGTRLPFVWVLMGCLGGFEVLGLVGLVIGPVALTLAREVWEHRVRDANPAARV